MFLLARRMRAFALIGAIALILSACSGTTDTSKQASVVEVLVMEAAPSAVEIIDELPGRVVAWRTAEIRPQVGGIIQNRLFEQGAFVHAGQPLFQINPAPFQAHVNNAAAALQRAQTAYDLARKQADRLKPLATTQVISRQNYDNAIAQRDQTAAGLAQARADLHRRQLDLDFARITSPISGQIGAAMLTEGALVTAQDQNPLAIVQQIDKVYVDVRQPVERFDALRQMMETNNGAGIGHVQILSVSGKPYPVTGRILFSGITVDPSTGNMLVRVEVDNPQYRLLPGMFVRAKLPRLIMSAAITVPQEAVTRNAAGRATLGVVDNQGYVQDREVTVGDVVNGRYIILTGLEAGETIVIIGRDRILPGEPVKTLPWHPAQH